MSDTRTLADVKGFYRTEKVFETATSFGVNVFGKYQPNITFIVPKDSEDDPLAYRSGQEIKSMVDSMNVDFRGGEPEAIFGDFWRSRKGGACFRPLPIQKAQHVLLRVRWGGSPRADHGNSQGYAEEIGALYFRRASSNAGGIGSDYWVLPIGFYHVIRDEELDGGAQAVKTDLAERAKVVRDTISRIDRERKEAADAKAQAEAEAKEASRLAKANFVPRLEAVQARLDALRANNPNTHYSELQLDEAHFSFGWSQRLYTEESVAETERNVTNMEEQADEKLRKQRARDEFQPQFETFTPRVEALGLSLNFGEEKVNWTGGSYYGGFTYDREGLKSFEADLVSKEEEVAKKVREEVAADAKAQAEAEAAELGLPQNIRIWKRTGGATNCGMGWVITPEGMDRERDGLENDNPRRAARYDEGYLVWKQILPGELVISWSKAYTAAPHEFKVIHLPSEGVTEAQLERVAEIEQELEETWAGRTGLASGIPSPSVSKGWGLIQ